jgi:hypothetical protein
VLQQVCLCAYPSERKRVLPFCILRVRPYIALPSERERERERENKERKSPSSIAAPPFS